MRRCIKKIIQCILTKKKEKHKIKTIKTKFTFRIDYNWQVGPVNRSVLFLHFVGAWHRRDTAPQSSPRYPRSSTHLVHQLQLSFTVTSLHVYSFGQNHHEHLVIGRFLGLCPFESTRLCIFLASMCSLNIRTQSRTANKIFMFFFWNVFC